ncbi:MAG: hypothetical protein LCH53_05865 [Bacteroidetes bacterium]|nr:hypothetical protein [Bacteroidota bacterium]
MTMLYGGRLLYMDDLVADETVRSRGYGRAAAGLAEGRGAAARKTNVRILSERFVQPSGGRAPSLRAAQGGGVTLGGVAA